jgi:DNA-binding LacI/PurR family transcriptional regulator
MRTSDQTRWQALRAIETLGYRPNASARELRIRPS